MAEKQPAFLFYTGDWKKDPNLSKCSAATRGIWIDLLCAMHENGRTGIITGTVVELAQMCRCSESEMSTALNELSRNKTAKIRKCPHPSTECLITNRRMNREFKSRERWRLQKQRQRKREMSASFPPSSSCSSSVPEELRGDLVSEKERKSRESSSVPRAGTLSPLFTEKLLEEIQGREAYRHLDVRKIFEKFKAYFEINGGTGNPSHFLGWLNREETPVNRNETSSDRIKRAFPGNG